MRGFEFSVLCAFLASVAVLSMLLGTGCQTVGVSDPYVRATAFTVANDLMIIYDLAESDAYDRMTVERYLLSTSEKLESLDSRIDDFTDLDREKYLTIRDGLSDVLANLDLPPYVRQRCKSLAALTLSLNVFEDSEAIDKMLDLLEEEERPDSPPVPQTQPAG